MKNGSGVTRAGAVNTITGVGTSATVTATPAPTGTTTKRGGTSSCLILPPKKRRLTNTATTSTTRKTETETRENQSQNERSSSDTEDAIKKLQDDYDTFIRQVGDLAALEREKNKLLEKFLAVSTAASGSKSNATTPSGEEGSSE